MWGSISISFFLKQILLRSVTSVVIYSELQRLLQLYYTVTCALEI